MPYVIIKLQECKIKISAGEGSDTVKRLWQNKVKETDKNESKISRAEKNKTKIKVEKI